ncbi:hypothetical protein GGI22_003337, partial [Coemansia erecta]
MKDHENPHDSYEEETPHSPSNPAAVHSPNSSLGTSRIASVPTAAQAGSDTSRTQSAAAVAPVSASSTSAARLRKSSEVNGLRPRSVEPGSDSGGGSALPATASWASRAMGKKPASGSLVDSRSRKSESGGTMTLRMIPASRAKTAVPAKAPSASIASSTGQQLAGSATAIGTATALSSAKNRTKGSAALANTNMVSVDGTSPSMASGEAYTADTVPASNPHHSGLQQLSRERKQQLRHQGRIQQKLAESADPDAGADADVEADTDHKRSNVKSRSRANTKGLASDAENLQQEGSADNAGTSHIIPSEAQRTTIEAAVATQPQDASLLHSAAVVPVQATEAAVGVQNPHTSPDYANSALSFQSITDSLFAQLNAKVSTATSANAVPDYPSVGSLAGQGAPGMRAPGYPTSGVDPLLFAPSVSGEAPAAGIPGRIASDIPLPSFSLFSGQQLPQWSSGSGAVPGAYLPQSSFNSIIGEPNALGAPMTGAFRDQKPGSSGFGQNPSRPKSRWEFAHADEA